MNNFSKKVLGLINKPIRKEKIKRIPYISDILGKAVFIDLFFIDFNEEMLFVPENIKRILIKINKEKDKKKIIKLKQQLKVVCLVCVDIHSRYVKYYTLDSKADINKISESIVDFLQIVTYKADTFPDGTIIYSDKGSEFSKLEKTIGSKHITHKHSRQKYNIAETYIGVLRRYLRDYENLIFLEDKDINDLQQVFDEISQTINNSKRKMFNNLSSQDIVDGEKYEITFKREKTKLTTGDVVLVYNNERLTTNFQKNSKSNIWFYTPFTISNMQNINGITRFEVYPIFEEDKNLNYNKYYYEFQLQLIPIPILKEYLIFYQNKLQNKNVVMSE